MPGDADPAAKDTMRRGPGGAAATILTRLGRVLLATLVGAVCSALCTAAWAAEIGRRVEIPAGDWQALRVVDLPAGALLGVEVETDGPLHVAVVTAEDYARYPEPEAPLFEASLERRLGFRVRAEKTGHHYVVLDNRAGEEPREVRLEVEATRGEAAPGAQGPTASDLPSADDTEARLSRFQDQLREFFVFAPFPIEIETCGRAEALTREGGVVLCRELAGFLGDAFDGDRERAQDMLLFSLFHEVGHVLLQQWESPFYDHEDAADEFATATMILLGQGERLAVPVAFLDAGGFERDASTEERRRHTAPAHRARNIASWARDPVALLRKWQPLLVPHMQTSALEKIREAEPAWADVPRVEAELAQRAGRESQGRAAPGS
jgi:hypothetical protein